MELKINVPGEACAQGRPRFRSFISKSGKPITHAYDPDKSKNYKSFVKLLAIDSMEKQCWRYTEIPIIMEISVYKELTKTERKSKKFMEAFNRGAERPTTKPDLDNVAKTIMDALSGVVYKDDKQIIKLTVSKHYTAMEPYVEVILKTWGW